MCVSHNGLQPMVLCGYFTKMDRTSVGEGPACQRLNSHRKDFLDGCPFKTTKSNPLLSHRDQRLNPLFHGL